MKKEWNSQRVELLINMMKANEEIWNTKHDNYSKSSIVRGKMWNELARKFNMSHKSKRIERREIQRKWNSLRLLFERENIKIAKNQLKKSAWRYYEQLLFLMDHPMKKHKGPCTINKKIIKTESKVPRISRPRRDANHFFTTNYFLPNENSETDSVGSITPKVHCHTEEDSLLPSLQNQNKNEYHKKRINSNHTKVNKTKYQDHAKERTSSEIQAAFGNFVVDELMYLETDLQLKGKSLIIEIFMSHQCEQEQRNNPRWC